MSDATMPDAMATLRAKYPQYNSIPDDQLATKIIAKYPQYQAALGKYVKPTGNFTANLTESDTPPIASPGVPAIPYGRPGNVANPSVLSGVVSGAVSGATQGEPDAIYEAPTNPGAMGAAPIYRNPVTGQRVSPLGYNPDPVQKFRDDYFNTLNENANIPMQAATALSKNPNDPAWLARVAKMSLIAQQEIPKKAQELANAPVYDSTPSGTLGTFGQAPIFRDPQTGARTAIPQPHDIIGTMLHGPEGYQQLQQAKGVIPELTRLAEGSLDPENLAFIAAAGAIGGMGAATIGGKALKIAGQEITGSAVVKAGIGAMMGANAVGKAKQGDYGGAAVDAALGLLPLAEHPISEAVGRVKSNLNNKALDAAQTNPTGRFAPDTPYQIPQINRPTVPPLAPVAPEIQTSPNSAPGLTPEIVKASAKDGFTKAADLYNQAKQADPTLTKQDFAQRLYDFHKANQDSVNYEGPTGNANKNDVFTAKTADGTPIRYFGFSEKTSKPTIQGEVNGKGSNSAANNGVDTGTATTEPAGVPPANESVNVQQPVRAPVSPESSPSSGAASESPIEPASGIRAANEETAARRAEKNLPELPGYTAKTSEEVYQEVRDRGQSADALNVADDVIRNKRAMTAHEIAANVLKQNEIEAQQDTLYKQIKEAAKAGTPHDTLLADYDALDQHYQKLTDATKYSGAEQSLAFRIRDYEVNRYSRNQVLKRLEIAKPDEPITEADKAYAAEKSADLTDTQKKLDEAQAKVDAQQAGRDEAASLDTAEKAIEKLKTKAQRSGRVPSADIKAKLDAEHEEIMRRFVKATSQANAFVDPKILPIIRDLAKNRVQYGIVKVGDLVDYVHAQVEPGIPGITKREVRDAISGHGYGSKIPVGSALSDLKKQMRLMSEIEDIKAKVQRPARTLRPVSPEEAALRQQKAEALAENRPPRKQTSAEKQLEGYKKQVSNKIDDLTRRINEKDFTAKTRSKLLLDPEATELKAQRDALQKVYDSLDPSKTPEARSQKARERDSAARLQRLEKQFEEMKAANAKGEYGKPNDPMRPDTPEEAAMRAKLDAARTERDAMRASKSEAPPADPLKAYKNRLATQIADMQTHIDGGLADRGTGGNTKQLDDDAKVLRDQRDQMKEAVNRKRAEIDRVIEARKGKSFLDKYAIYHRAAILSRLTTLAKLSSAGLQRLIFTPAEEGAGALMHAVPGYGKIAKMAPHGTPSIAAEGAALRSVADYKANYADSMQKFRTGMNSLDAKYGTKGYEQDADQLNLFTAPQNAHGAIKTTFQRAAFERSMVQQERYELRQGHDINDPAVRTVMEARAYMKSKEAILMQDNMLSTAWNGMVTGLEKNPNLGKLGKNSAAVLRAALPIVKVPSNFVGEVASHTPGIGLIRPGYELAMSKGIENLSPEQADIIVTALKKHAVGTALFALGYFNADKMGGFYAKGGNGMNDVKPNELRINLFGKEMDVPSWLLHSPQMEVMMMGAAFKQAIEQAGNSRSREPKSPAGEALHRTATGLADALPFVDTPKRVLGVMEGTTQAGKEVGNTLGSLTIPGFLPDIASQIDRDPQNHLQTRKRPAKGFGDAMRLSTGVLRETVPEDSGRRR